RGNASRDFQDSRSISFKDGGDDVRRKPDSRLQYAGIVVQYFASVVVVDDQQETRDFLAWARPTLVDYDDRDKDKPYLDDITARVISEPIELNPGESKVHRYLLYNGPVKVRLLGQLTGAGAVDPKLIARYEDTLQLRTLTDYHSPGGFGEFANSIRWT